MLHTLLEDFTVFPASAGMDRLISLVVVAMARFPRERGDGPVIDAPVRPTDGVFPASAGMDRPVA